MESRPERNIPQFNGDCYGAWKFRIKTVLEELQVYSVIEGPPPENPDDEWTAKNNTAKSTIVNFLSNAFLHFAEGSATAKSIIDGLDKLYERRNLTAQVSLRKSLLNLKLYSNSLSQHFVKFDKLISGLISSGANMDEMDKVCQLLATLPYCYERAIGPFVELYGDNFNLALVKTYLLDQEAKMEMETVSRLKDTVTESAPNKRRKPNNYQYNHRNPSYSASNMFCEFCGRNNHFIQDCYTYNSQMEANMHQNAHKAAPPGKRNIFSAMFPLHNHKVSKKLKRKAFINSTQHRRITNINPYSAPNIKNELVMVKQEPVTVKLEPVGIKEEPVWVKQEPQWGEQSIKMEPGTENSTQDTMYVKMEPSTENSTEGTVFVKMEGTENSTQGTAYAKGTEISTQSTVYLQNVPNRKTFKTQRIVRRKRGHKRAHKIAMLMMEAENRTDVGGTELPLTNPVHNE